MAKYNYVLSYNPYMQSPNADQLQLLISKHREIGSWYLPFSGTYVLKSDLSLAELQSQFQPYFASSPFILTWVPSRYATGSLPPVIWEWFNDQPNLALPGK